MTKDLTNEDLRHVARPANLGWSKTFAVVAGLLFAGACANASTISVTGTVGTTSSCHSGLSGTLTIDGSGGVLLEAPSGSTTGCYVGGYTGTAGSPTPSGADTTFISGLSGEGTAAGLGTLVTGWYAEFGAICGGASQCTASNNSTNNNSSGDIEVLVNSGVSSTTFQIKDNLGNIDTAANPSISGACSYTTGSGGATFTVSSGTVCFEDLSTGGSIAFTIGTTTTSTTPEGTTLLLVATGLLVMGSVRRRMRSRASLQ